MNSNMKTRLELTAKLSTGAVEEMYCACVLVLNIRAAEAAIAKGDPTVEIYTLEAPHIVDPKRYIEDNAHLLAAMKGNA